MRDHTRRLAALELARIRQLAAEAGARYGLRADDIMDEVRRYFAQTDEQQRAEMAEFYAGLSEAEHREMAEMQARWTRALRPGTRRRERRTRSRD